VDRYRIEEKPGLYVALHVYECPPSLLERSIELASGVVTVENLRPTRAPAEWIDLSVQLYADDVAGTRSVRNVALDVTMSAEEFRSHLPFWDREGVYAVFTARGPLAFRATDLDGPGRYRALRNYGWTLELAIGGGGGWGTISSPDPTIIQQLRDVAAVCHGEGRR
jgi:hypothetical protein